MPAIIGSLTGLLFVMIPLVWIIMHYKSQGKNSDGLSSEEAKQLDELLRVADSMADRIKSLESILDAEYPDWREQDGKE